MRSVTCLLEDETQSVVAQPFEGLDYDGPAPPQAPQFPTRYPYIAILLPVQVRAFLFWQRHEENMVNLYKNYSDKNAFQKLALHIRVLAISAALWIVRHTPLRHGLEPKWGWAIRLANWAVSDPRPRSARPVGYLTNAEILNSMDSVPNEAMLTTTDSHFKEQELARSGVEIVDATVPTRLPPLAKGESEPLRLSTVGAHTEDEI